jgi:hypothetical protein
MPAGVREGPILRQIRSSAQFRESFNMREKYIVGILTDLCSSDVFAKEAVFSKLIAKSEFQLNKQITYQF